MSTDDNEYSIGEVAALLKVTTRTLRHWDGIGLLSPQWRTVGDHRLYTEDDLQRGMDIVIYRSVGIELKDIAELLQAPAASAVPKDRRRPGRLDQVSPHLVPLLRTSSVAEAAAADMAEGMPGDALAPAKGIAIGLALSVPVWAVIGGVVWAVL